MLRAAAIVLLAGCSSILGIEDLGGPAGTPDGGGPNDTVPPGQVRISGSTLMHQKVDTPPFELSNARLELVTEDMTVMTTSSGMANYQFDIAPSGDAFVRVLEVPGAKETVNHLQPITDDVSIDLITFDNNYPLEVGQLAGDPQELSLGFLQIRIIDELGRPQPSVQLLVSFANRVIYADDTGRPGPTTSSSTSGSGLAWVTNAPPGDHALEARRNGLTVAQRIFTVSSTNGQVDNAHITILVPSRNMP